MYADRVSSGSNKRPVKDRLNNGNPEHDDHFPSTRQAKSSKRQRQNDDKWKHDLYDDDEAPQVSNPKVGGTDLRSKLQKKSHDQVNRGGKDSSARGTQDLREKLSGPTHAQPVNDDRPQTKKVVEVSKLGKKNLPVGVPKPETRKPTNLPIKKSQQKTESSVDSLLQSLGLEKYSITFQAEEVDMTALTHMNDEDLKALGIPMGPRKKILLALNSRG